jgi:hypothetical protein
MRVQARLAVKNRRLRNEGLRDQTGMRVGTTACVHGDARLVLRVGRPAEIRERRQAAHVAAPRDTEERPVR